MPSSADRIKLTHVDSRGQARMVDVTAKPVTARRATATGSVSMNATARELLAAGELAKGDALAVARIAGIAAAKRTPDLVPLCHPVAVGSVAVDVVPTAEGVDISATVATADRTGIEMEALTCVVVAALTVVDMVKAVDRNATIGPARIVAKTGGRSGDWGLDSSGALVPVSSPSLSGEPSLSLRVSSPSRALRDEAPDLPSAPPSSELPPDPPRSGASSLRDRSSGQPPRSGADSLRDRSSGVSSSVSGHDGGSLTPLAGRAALVVTVSDRRAAGVAADTTGPQAVRRLAGLGARVDLVVVPDGVEELRGVARRAVADGVDVVVTTGGTGVGPRDLTPEALEPVVTRRLPGVEQAIRASAATPLAALSRTVVGVVGERTVVAALPGSARAVNEGLDALEPLWGHLLDQLAGGDHDEPVPAGGDDEPVPADGDEPAAAAGEARR